MKYTIVYGIILLSVRENMFKQIWYIVVSVVLFIAIYYKIGDLKIHPY